VRKLVNDLLELFKKAYDLYGDKLILDSYKPDNGLYIRICSDDLWESTIISKDGSDDTDLYNWFKKADYYSSLIDMNKAVDTKKTIHSNNYMSIFIKKDILPEVGESEKILTNVALIESLERYFDIFKKNSKASSKDVERIDYNKVYILSNIPRLIEFIKSKNIGKKDYVKIFFQADLEKYKHENTRYLIPRIFNKNDYNLSIESKTYGLSNNNMGMNSKKPYLELMSTKFKVPFRVDVESALIIKKLFEWLECQDSNNLYIPVEYDFKSSLGTSREKKPFYYIYLTRGTGLTIEDFDYLPHFTEKIKFVFYNFLQIQEAEKGDKYILDDENINSIFELEDRVNGYFYSGRLKNSYYQIPKVKTNEFSKTLLDLLIISRKAMHDYFKKGIETDLRDIINRVSIEVVKEQLKMAQGISINKPAKALNLRLSFLKYFKLRGENMGDKIKSMIDMMNGKLALDNLATCENDDEFYFLAGQLAYYMLSQSEAAKKTHGLVEPFLRSKNAEYLKRQLGFTFDRYKHAISMNYSKFNNAMSAVQGYTTNKNLIENQDMFLAGFMSKNIFYDKKDSKDLNKGGSQNGK
jgi:CRISPR-associated protein Csh1